MRLGFSGDITLSVLNDDSESRRSAIYSTCREITDSVDVAVGNLESVIVLDDSDCRKKVSVSRSQCGLLEEAGFDVFSLANNHIMDCGRDGLRSTLDYLHGSGLATVGAGMDRRQADACHYMNLDDRRVAFLAVTDASHYRASRSGGGVSSLEPGDVFRRVADASQQADLVVVSIHSDFEFTNRPAPWKVRLSRRLVASGADIVVHHHPHTLQGIERFEGGLIAYSLGNFLFPVHGTEYMRGRAGHVDEGAFLAVDITWGDGDEKYIQHEVIPVVIDSENLTHIASDERRLEILRKLTQYNDYLGDMQTLRRCHFRRCRHEAAHFLRGTYYAFRKEGVKRAYRYVVFHLQTKMHRNWMRGCLTLGYG